MGFAWVESAKADVARPLALGECLTHTDGQPENLLPPAHRGTAQLLLKRGVT